MADRDPQDPSPDRSARATRIASIRWAINAGFGRWYSGYSEAAWLLDELAAADARIAALETQWEKAGEAVRAYPEEVIKILRDYQERQLALLSSPSIPR